jgi:acid phosphatase family membrane protein YuiD
VVSTFLSLIVMVDNCGFLHVSGLSHCAHLMQKLVRVLFKDEETFDVSCC